MAVIKCPSGHFYDDSKFNECPHCKNGLKKNDYSSGFTIRKDTVNEDVSAGKTIAKEDFAEESHNSDRTVSFFAVESNVNPVCGWLVCISGENRGRSYEIHVGKNFIGRSMYSDIAVNDKSISRNNHFSVIFDPKSLNFFITPESSMVWLNSSLLEKSGNLSEDDIIEAGGSKFRFVPFCKEGRDWND